MPHGWGVEPESLSPGDGVEISYLFGTVSAIVREVEPMGRYGPMRGWIRVEQMTDFPDPPRPIYEAGAEFMRKVSGAS
jgi:hypothetical protein